MDHRVVIVGGGMAGLTAAAYLGRAGVRVLLLEKEETVGGLVNTFEDHGFVFDGGIRAIENSGIVEPMLRQLGLEVPFVRSGVSIGIEDKTVDLRDKGSLGDYLRLLQDKFPDSGGDIGRFGAEIEKIMGYMDVLYGIDNPLFLNLKGEREYLMKTLLPWFLKYIVTIRKISRLDRPVAGYLENLVRDPALVDIIAQHFFQETPTFFALSYFSLYLDYKYPRGGTGVLAATLLQYILDRGGEIRCGVEVDALDPERREVRDTEGRAYPYERLVWCADLQRLYRAVAPGAIRNRRTARAIEARRRELAGKVGNDSILTLFLALDLEPAYFGQRSNPHFFYTPSREGLGRLDIPIRDGDGYTGDPAALREWLRQYFRLTTYEISCPALRDPSLAPPGRTGLIVSTLFDYRLARHIADAGWYEAFKKESADTILEVLGASVYPGLKDRVLDCSVSTPLTLERRTGNTDGAITGWAFTNRPVPAVHRMTQVAKSVRTPIPGVLQAGQWSFSPSGLPISILTGKLAADRVIRELT